MTAPDSRQDLGTVSVPAGEALDWKIPILAPVAVDLTTFGSSWSADFRLGDPSYPTPVVATVTVTTTTTANDTLRIQLSTSATTTMGTSSAPNGAVWYADVKATGGSVSPQWPFKCAVVVRQVFTP